MVGLNIDKSKWKKVLLSELAEDISEREDNPSQSSYKRFVGLEHFVSGDLKIKNWTNTENLVSAAKVFKAGDVLFARRNTYLRRASMVDFDGLCSGDAFVLRENHKMIIPGYLTFILNSDKLWDYANINAAGTMSKRVKWRDLENYEVSLPPKEQQAELAGLLWAIDDIIVKYLNLGDRLEKVRQSFHNSYFDIKNKISIDEIATKVGSGKTPLGGEKVYTSKGILFLRSQNILFGNISLEDVAYISEEIHQAMSFSKVQNDDVLLNITGASIGRSAVFKSSDKFKEANVNQHVCIIRSPKYLPNVLSEYLNSRFGQDQINTLQTGGNRQGLNFQNLRKLTIPNFSESQIIHIDSIISIIKSNQSQVEGHINNTILLKKQLINQIFSD